MLSTLVEKGVILLQEMPAQNENKNTSSIVITMNNQPHFALYHVHPTLAKKGKNRHQNEAGYVPAMVCYLTIFC